MSAKDTLKNFGKKITPAYITKLAVLTGISFILYMFAKFNLAFMFPSFLDMQFSELPAILAGFSLGPVAGVLVIILKCLLKFQELPISTILNLYRGITQTKIIIISVSYYMLTEEILR